MRFDGLRSVTMILAATAAVGLTAVAGAGAVMAGTRTAVASGAAAVSGTWRTARKIPGIAALNRGGHAQVSSVSCGAPGNCSAGGWYTDSSGRSRAFLVSEAKGTWHTATEVPGIAALSTRSAQVNTVSCASAGNCAAGGSYVDRNGDQAFAATEANGIWHKAFEVPGSAALNLGGYAGITSVSCSVPGNCTAGGYYLGSSTSYQGFVVIEVDGTWHHAIRVPGILSSPANGHVGPTAKVSSVSCASAGNCSIGGSYYDSVNIQAFVGSEVNGVWRKATKIPGTATLNHGDAQVNSVSCGSAGNCSVGGWYMDNSSLDEPLVASEVNGAWHKAIRVPGMTALTQHIFGAVTSVSCASAGNCSAGGWYTDSADRGQPFVVSEVNGAWQHAVKVPGIAALNRGNEAVINSVSCASVSNCSALGSYTDSSGDFQVYAVSKAPAAVRE